MGEGSGGWTGRSVSAGGIGEKIFPGGGEFRVVLAVPGQTGIAGSGKRTGADAEDHVLALPLLLLDQAGATATLEGTATTLTLHEVFATVQASHLGCRVFYTVNLRGRLTE